MTIGDQVRRIEPSDQVVLDSDGNVVGIKSGKSSGLEGRMLLPTTADAVQALVSRDGITGWPAAPNVRRWNPGKSVLKPAGRIADWSVTNAANGAITEVSSPNPMGPYALRMATDAVAGQFVSMDANVTFNINTLAGIWLLLNVGFKQSNGLTITVSTSNALNMAVGTGRFTVNGIVSTLIVGRNPVWIPKTKFTTADGSPSWANDQLSLRIRMDSNVASLKQIDVEGIFTGGGRPQCIVSFDDGWDSSYTIGHVEARKRGIPLSHFIIAQSVGSANYITLAQLREMQAAGDYTGLHGATVWDQNLGRIITDIAACEALGVDTKHASIVGSQIGDGFTWQAMKSIFQANGVLSARIGGSATPPYAPPILPGVNDPYTMPCTPLNNHSTLAQAKAALDEAIAAGGTCNFYGHKLGGTADAITWVTADYIALLDYIQQKRLEGVIDTPRWDNWYSGAY